MSVTTEITATAAYPSLARWVLACAAAEAIGMTAAATAARAGEGLDPMLALSLIVAGGLVEGVVVGAAQATVLGRWLPHLRVVRWMLLTTLVAGLGWAAASAPAQLPAATGEDATPPLALVIAGALALGAAMGAILGVVQATVLRGHVPHPWRWVAVSTVAWTPAMAIIFVGATAPDETWSTPVVVALGTATGVLAGAVLGALSWVVLPVVRGESVVNRIVLAVLGSRAHGMLSSSVLGVRVHGRRTGRVIELPVQFAATAGGYVTYPAHPAHKQWWHNVEAPTEVEVLVGGAWHPALGHVVRPSEGEYAARVADYRSRWPKVAVAAGDPVVVIEPR